MADLRDKPRLIVFASGTKDGGGSGFERLVEATKTGELDAEIVAVVSNHENGGVQKRAERLDVPFVHFDPAQYREMFKGLRMKRGANVTADAYKQIVQGSGAEWVALSGWLRHVSGLDPAKTINIHPALLSYAGGMFGGKGMYGHRIHEAVKAALDAGELTESGFTMHFVTEEHDKGPAFFEYRVPLEKGMTADDIAKAVNEKEHEWQPKITNMVVHGEISWDGRDPKTLTVPPGYQFLPKPKNWC